MGVLTVKNSAREYDLGLTKAYNLIASGNLVAKKVGKRTLITRESAERWFAACPAMIPGAVNYGGSHKGRKPGIPNRATGDDAQPTA
jgi:hypothetical protein